jgi:hypothetical protein
MPAPLFGYFLGMVACFVVRDSNGQQLAYVYFRGSAGAKIGGKTTDAGRGTKDRGECC